MEFSAHLISVCITWTFTIVGIVLFFAAQNFSKTPKVVKSPMLIYLGLAAVVHGLMGYTIMEANLLCWNWLTIFQKAMVKLTTAGQPGVTLIEGLTLGLLALQAFLILAGLFVAALSSKPNSATS